MSMQILTGSIEQFRRAVPLDDATIVDPTNALPLLQGEWLVNNVNGWDRIAADISGDIKLTFDTLGRRGRPRPVFSQKGDSVVQVLGKTSVIEGSDYRAEFTVYKRLGLTTASYIRGVELTIAAMDLNAGGTHQGRTVLLPAVSGDPVVAVVETPPASMGAAMVVDVVATYPMA